MYTHSSVSSAGLDSPRQSFYLWNVWCEDKGQTLANSLGDSWSTLSSLFPPSRFLQCPQLQYQPSPGPWFSWTSASSDTYDNIHFSQIFFVSCKFPVLSYPLRTPRSPQLLFLSSVLFLMDGEDTSVPSLVLDEFWWGCGRSSRASCQVTPRGSAVGVWGLVFHAEPLTPKLKLKINKRLLDAARCFS